MFGIPVWFLVSFAVCYAAAAAFVFFVKHYTVKLYIPESVEWNWECHDCYGWKNHEGQCPYYADCEF